MSSITSSIIFKNIFSAQDVSTVWSDRARTENYLRFEGLLALAQADLGIVPQDAASLINTFCSDVNNVDFEQLREETENIGYPVLGLVKQIVRHVNAKRQGCGEWAHYGATTQDVTDTATVLQLRSTLELVSASLE
ncbi:hypothetical protein PAXINDRAFT_37162, partial [Paxillus involutus ATCC 200175]